MSFAFRTTNSVGSLLARQSVTTRHKRGRCSAIMTVCRRRTRRAISLSDRIGPEPRLRFLGAMILLLSVGVSVRLYCLQGAECERWSKIASKQHDSSIGVRGARGNILDASGRSLAVSVRGLSVGAHPSEVKDKRLTAERLAALIDQPRSTILEKLSSDASFVWLARGLPESSGDSIRSARLEGVVGVPDFHRSYPQGTLAGPILGRVNTDGEGLSGIELSFNHVLSAPNLRLAVRRDAKGRLFPARAADQPQDYGELIRELPKLFRVSERSEAEPDLSLRREGKEIELTIDSLLQEILETELVAGRDAAHAERTFGLLLDAESGEILALGQSPGFDPASEKVSPEALRNSVLQDSFEPGSTIKPLVAALALEARVTRVNETLDCENGSYTVGSHTVRDVHPQKLLSFGDVLVRSSNICMAKLGQRMGRESLYEGLRSLGFGDLTRIELGGESKGILRSLDNWAEIDTLTHSFGQGFSVTSLQLVQAYTALANDGLMAHPTILKSPSHRRPPMRVLTPETAHAVSDILRGVIEDEHGTGQKAAIKGISVRGKTGTAQKARSDGRGYDPDRILASFIGFVDGNEIGLRRKLVMFVAVDEPGVRPRWGGTVAAPVFQRVMERVVAHLLTLQAQDGFRTAGLSNEKTAAG